MKLRTLFILIVLCAIAGFTALNWSTIMVPTALSLGVATVQAPLGLVMLSMLVFLTALFLLFVVYIQGSVLVDTRRHARELQTNRKLVDEAETSRFSELREFLESELKRLAALDTESRQATQTRLDQLDEDLRSAVEQSGNTLAAYIGELEDRLEKGSESRISNPSS
jgi:hypothetical protein